MASVAYNLMQEYNFYAGLALEEKNYETKFVFDNAESVVNSLHHGRSATEWIPALITALRGNASLDGVTDIQRETYIMCAEIAEGILSSL